MSTSLPERVCALEGCDVTFRPSRQIQRCCSERHGKVLWNTENSHRRYAPPVDVSCCVCGASISRRVRPDRQPACSSMCKSFLRYGRWPLCSLPVRHRARRRADLVRLADAPMLTLTTPRRPRFVNSTCRRCGDSFTIDQHVANGGVSEAAWCSKRCARSQGKARRRALKRATYIEPVSPRKVYERDGWRCHLCRKPVDKTASVPNWQAATIDHVVPLSRGGEHSYANIRTAHFICNARKGDRSASEQLALI